MTCCNVPVLTWPCKPRPPIQARIAKEGARPLLGFSTLQPLLPLGTFCLGRIWGSFFLLNVSDIHSWLKWPCSPNELLWLLMCPKQIFELFSAAGPACPECTEFCSAHTYFLSDLWHPEGHDSTAEERHSTSNCTETGWISDFEPHQCPLDSPVHDMPLQCTKTHTLEGTHRKRCAVFVQKLIIHVSQTP